MKVFENGVYRDMTAAELAEIRAEQAKEEQEYWANVSYAEAVNAEIRKQYSESDEFAILRQMNRKPQEYEEYDRYCEQCKKYVKEKKGVIT